MNEIRLLGILEDLEIMEKISIATIKVKREYVKTDGISYDLVPVKCFGQSKEKVDASEKGIVVLVNAKIQSSVREYNSKKYKDIDVIADKISRITCAVKPKQVENTTFSNNDLPF